MHLQACFGRLSRETLLTWHQNNMHPYPICSRHVKNNMIEAHGNLWGPYTISQHDVGHVLFNSNAPKEDRDQFLAVSRFCLTLRDQLDKNPVEPDALNNQLKKAFDGCFDELNDLVLLAGYNHNWKGNVESAFSYKFIRGDFNATKVNLYQYFQNLKNTGKHPEAVQAVIDATISELEKKYPELAKTTNRVMPS